MLFELTNPEIAILMMSLFLFAVLLGFPIAFTLLAMGVGFGYYAYFDPTRMDHFFDNRIFSLLVSNTYTIMDNTVLTAVPLFLFMGYLVERAGIVAKLFFAIRLASHRLPASMAVAALVTCALFSTATGIIGAVVTLMGLLAWPAMIRAGYGMAGQPQYEKAYFSFTFSVGQIERRTGQPQCKLAFLFIRILVENWKGKGIAASV